MWLEIMWRVLVMEGHETVVCLVDDAVESGIEAEDDDDDEPAGDEVYEEPNFI